MLTETTFKFINSLKVDPRVAAPLADVMVLLARKIDGADRPSASLISEYIKVWTKLNALNAGVVEDPVEDFLNALPH